MIEHRNTILAVVLSLIVVVGWQYFVGYPQMEKQRREALLKQQEQTQQQPSAATPATPGPQVGTPPVPGAPAAASPSVGVTREALIDASAHVAIDTPRLNGSIDLKGARIDNLALEQYRETIDRELAADRAVFALRRAGRLLCGVRLGAGRGHDCQIARARHGMEAGRQRRARRRSSGDASLRQRRGIDLPPHHRGRRPLSLHHQGPGREQEREPGHAVSLCADLAPRHAEDARLLHPARGPDRRHGRPGRAGRDLQDDRGQERSRPGTRPTSGSASPTNTGRPRYCPTPTPRCTRASRRANPAARRPTRPTICSIRRPSRRARPAPPTRGCSPAPRRSRSSASISRSRPPAATTRRSTSTISIC